jgi:hypothetical protein
MQKLWIVVIVSIPFTCPTIVYSACALIFTVVVFLHIYD